MANLSGAAEVEARIKSNNLDHLSKTAVANNADMTTEVVDGSVISNFLTRTGDTSDFVPDTDSLEGISDKIGTPTNTGGTATVGAILGDFVNNTVKAMLDDLTDGKNDESVLVQAFNATTTVINATITLFALSAWDGPRKNVRVEFWLDADAAATFTPAWYATRSGAQTTFVARGIPAIATIVTPAAGRYGYEYGDLAQGDRLEFRVAQTNAGDATNAIDATLTYER